MTFEILITRKAEDDLKKLDPIVKKRIKKNLLKLRNDPQSLSKKLTRIKGYKFRVGNYRIIFDIDKDNIVILRVGHRREIYKK